MFSRRPSERSEHGVHGDLCGAYRLPGLTLGAAAVLSVPGDQLARVATLRRRQDNGCRLL
jgi:hypothetical protein